jgi:hypothetical protein
MPTVLHAQARPLRMWAGRSLLLALSLLSLVLPARLHAADDYYKILVSHVSPSVAVAGLGSFIV